jgi:predicted TPR repeat methyltransferase
MSSSVALKAADKLAKDYDHYVSHRGWIGPDVVYNMLKSYITRAQKLLDIGIGTGLSSIQFYKSGVNIYGLDGSAEMLKECASKNFTEELVLFDLLGKEFPFKQTKFDFIITYGVFHITGFIEHIFKEVSFRLFEQGIFLFSVVENDSCLDEEYEPTEINGIFVNRNNPSQILNYSHEDSYVRKLINRAGLELFDKKSILAFYDVQEEKQVHFSIYACRKTARTYFTATAEIST